MCHARLLQRCYSTVVDRSHFSLSLDKQLVPTNENKACSDRRWFSHVATCTVRGKLHCSALVLRVSRPRRPFSSPWPHEIAVSLDTIDLLLLDEPTNHLDLEGVAWLSKQLTGGIGDTMVLMVSHDAAFIDAVVTDVIHFQRKQLSYYAGDYSAFMKVWGGVIWRSTCRPLSRVFVWCLSQFFVVSHPVLFVGIALTTVSAFAQSSLSALSKTQAYAMAQLVCSLCHSVDLSWSIGSFVRIPTCLAVVSGHTHLPGQLYNCSPRRFEARSGVTRGINDASQYVRSLERLIDLSRLLLRSPTFVSFCGGRFQEVCGFYFGEVTVSSSSRTPSDCPCFFFISTFFSRGTDEV